MKGIAHFITGVALATCWPDVVRLAADGSLLPVLGGIAGLLPDTLDFKFARYFVPYDREFDPGLEPDPEALAEGLVEMMTRAYETGRPQRVVLHTVRLGADLWRSYGVTFDSEAGEVAVEIGPAVSTGRVPYPGVVPAGGRAVRPIAVPLVPTYNEQVDVAAFSGPSLLFERQGDRLLIHFLDWHRHWSHSLVVGAALGLLAAVFGGALAGWVVGLGWAGHVLEDQLGYLGSNLAWPLTRRRVPGLGWLHSGDALPNALTVWLSLALILYNLDRFGAQLSLPAPFYYWAGALFPVVVGIVGSWWQRRRERLQPAEFYRQAESLAEAEYREIS